MFHIVLFQPEIPPNTGNAIPQADIAVFMSGPLIATAGGPITYSITVTNLGPLTSTNVVVTDDLPTNEPLHDVLAHG